MMSWSFSGRLWQTDPGGKNARIWLSYVILQNNTTVLETFNPGILVIFQKKCVSTLTQLSREKWKAYFPVSPSLPGLFAVIGKLYGLQISEITKRRHLASADVQFFQIQDDACQLRRQFYIDLYARAKKRGGAWMDDCAGRKKNR